MSEPPYGVIWNRLKAGKVVPFLGAGASFAGRPPDARWDAATPTFLPSGLELAHFLAGLGVPETSGFVPTVCQHILTVGRKRHLRYPVCVADELA